MIYFLRQGLDRSLPVSKEWINSQRPISNGVAPIMNNHFRFNYASDNRRLKSAGKIYFRSERRARDLSAAGGQPALSEYPREAVVPTAPFGRPTHRLLSIHCSSGTERGVFILSEKSTGLKNSPRIWGRIALRVIFDRPHPREMVAGERLSVRDGDQRFH